MSRSDLGCVRWRKSSYSGGTGGECVELCCRAWTRPVPGLQGSGRSGHLP
ncbi:MULTISPECIES: DUF397 domain-containing protein [Actinomadura]|nr:DUF397 domain-containing protein [Actinomadura madurae]